MGQLRAEYPTGRYNNNIRSSKGPNGQKNGSSNKNNEGGQTNTNKEANDGTKYPQDEEELLNLSFLQMDGRCFVCGSANHRILECPKHNTVPKAEWEISKVAQKEQAHAQVTMVADQGNDSQALEGMPPSIVVGTGWSSAQYLAGTFNHNEMHDMIY